MKPPSETTCGCYEIGSYLIFLLVLFLSQTLENLRKTLYAVNISIINPGTQSLRLGLRVGHD